MNKSIILLLLSIALITGLAAACSPAATSATGTATAPLVAVDKPGLTSEEAIAIAHRHCVRSPANIQEETAGRQLKVGANDMKYWNAIYTGNGKWNVSAKVNSETVHWTVFESNFSAVFAGAD